MNGFYRLNNEVLKFDPVKETDRIIFNHYIMQKENYQRLKGDLPIGQFYLSISAAATDLDMKKWKVESLIKCFKEKEIINVIEVFPSHMKKPSIYEYLVAINTYREETEISENNQTQNTTRNQTQIQTQEQRISNGLISYNQTQEQTQNQTRNQKSKKELLKKNYKKDIYIQLPEVENVKLTQEQYDKLIAEYGNVTIADIVLDLDNYIVNGKGKNYKDHNKVIRTWLRKRCVTTNQENTPSTTDYINV